MRAVRVVISAYACAPGDAPEAAAGWAFATAASMSHEVEVYTRARFRTAIEAELERQPRARLTVRYHELPGVLLKRKRRPRDLYWYYPAWQATLARRLRARHRAVPVDVIHHVTFANDWMPCAAAHVPGVPFVWGPVGGASRSPVRLARWLGWRGTVVEIVRASIVAAVRRVFGDLTASRAAVVVAQNADVAGRFARHGRIVVEPNASLSVEPRQPLVAGHPPVAVYVGRLVGLKGVRLAVEGVARLAGEGWSLDIIGEGPDRSALERLARQKGLRVRFHGHLPREEALARMASADVLVFPSVHDQAGWVAGEASAMGVPVVCLPFGGPPLLAGPNAVVASDRGDVVGHIAAAVRRAAAMGGVPHDRWSESRLPRLVNEWYEQAVRGPRPS